MKYPAIAVKVSDRNIWYLGQRTRNETSGMARLRSAAAGITCRGDARRAEIRQLLEEGKITTGEDFSDAALIFQHGQTPEEFLFAHILATEALIRGGSDKWIVAAMLDRYLQAVNRPQVFGTQYTGDKAAGNTPKPQVDPHARNIQRTQQPYDSKLLSDSMRQDFCVPDVSQQEKNLAIFNTGHRPERRLMRAVTCSQ